MTKKTKIIIGSAAVMILAVLVAVVSLRRPSDPLDWKFSIETFEDDMDKVFENLSEDDRGAIISHTGKDVPRASRTRTPDGKRLYGHGRRRYGCVFQSGQFAKGFHSQSQGRVVNFLSKNGAGFKPAPFFDVCLNRFCCQKRTFVF